MNRLAPHRMRRRASRWLCNPITTIVLLALLVTDAASLPFHNNVGGRSFVGTFVYYVIREGRTHTYAAIDDFAFVRAQGGLTLIDPAAGTLGDAVSLSQSEPSTVLWAHFLTSHDRDGLWAITRDSIDWRLVLEPADPDSPPTEAERSEAARLLAAHYAGNSRPEYAQALNRGGRTESHRLWSGYAHNTLSLAAFLALLYSLQWIPRTPAWFRERRERRAATLNLCPRCRYPRAGLEPGSPCPECGRVDPSPSPEPAAP